MHKLPLNYFVDVDGVLIDHNDNLNKELVEELSRIKENGSHLICWSAGGEDYALKILKEHKIDHLFNKVISKPDVAIDDELNMGIKKFTANEFLSRYHKISSFS